MSENTIHGVFATVLVTEDEPVVRAFARIALEEAGHRALEAASVDDALHAVKSEGALDVLFTDINLRPLSRGGVELAIEAMKLRPNLRVIYTTGKALTNELRSMFVDGGVFIPKPYTPHSLCEAVVKVLSR